MLGKLKWRKSLDKDLEVWEVEDLDTKSLVPIVVSKKEYDYEDMKKYPYLQITTQICGLLEL